MSEYIAQEIEETFARQEQGQSEEEEELNLKEAVAYLIGRGLRDAKPDLLYDAKAKKLIAFHKAVDNRLHFTHRALDDFIDYLQKRDQQNEPKQEITGLNSTPQTKDMAQDIWISVGNSTHPVIEELPKHETGPTIPEVAPITCHRCSRVFWSPEDYTITQFLEDGPNGAKTVAFHPVCKDRRCDPEYLQEKNLQEQNEEIHRTNLSLIQGLRDLRIYLDNRIDALIETHALEGSERHA